LSTVEDKKEATDAAKDAGRDGPIIIQDAENGKRFRPELEIVQFLPLFGEIDRVWRFRQKLSPMKTPLILLMAAASIVLTSGCVTGRRSLDVDVPPADASTPAPKVAGKGPITLGDVSDNRVFENGPGSPSTPSVNGDVDQLSAAQKSTFIGRQRNGFGHAMGDITLPEGQTVQGKVSDLIREGLKRRGYDVTGTTGAPNTVTAEVQQFWTWMTPGFFALSFEAHLAAKISVTSNGKTVSFIVKGYGLNHGQFAKDSNWKQAYDIAFQDFITNLNAQLDASGL
jgi:Uncharacterized lipoprotein